MCWIERRGLYLKSLFLSDDKGLCAEIVCQGSETDLDVACFAAGSCMSVFICSSLFKAMHSAVIASPSLRWMKNAIDTMKMMVGSSFLQPLSVALLELKYVEISVLRVSDTTSDRSGSNLTGSTTL